MEPQLPQAIAQLLAQQDELRQGTGPKAAARQHEKGRLTARERIAKLIDPESSFFELGLWAAWNMYPRTVAGLLACYEAGIPFFRHAVTGDLLFTAAMFATPVVFHALSERLHKSHDHIAAA